MIRQLIEENRQYVIDIRRHLHMHPELSWKEYETSRFVKSELEKAGIPCISIAETGLVAEIKGNSPGKTIALRADMDGISVTEENKLEYASKTSGVMHACGHDGHTAMLLGAAKALSKLKDRIKGTVKLFFQPAEEEVQGAAKMISEGALEGVDSLFGIHLWADLPYGKVNCEGGPRMASGDYVQVDITGRGGHGSMPEQGVDACLVTAAFLTNIQMFVSREISPLDSAVVTFGDIKCGDRFNILAGTGCLKGTARCFDPELRSKMPEIIKRYGDNIAGAYRAKCEVTIREGCPPVINDNRCAEIAREVIESSMDNSSHVMLEKVTAGEDIAYYFEKIPGAIAFVGCRNEETGACYPHHHPKFNIDERSLEIGTELYTRYALMFLEKYS